MLSPKFTAKWWPGIILALTFFLLGSALIPYPGLQQDEVLFIAPYFHLAGSSLFRFGIFHRRIPVMFLTYEGALKNWLCAPIFQLAAPTSWTVRLPALLLGTLTILLFVRLLETVHSRRAAWIGGVLLATDTMFLLTTCFDWGPVAFQHFLLVAGALLLVKFAAEQARPTLFWGFFCFGLGLWDKALFSWILIGLTFASVLIFPRELWKNLTARNAKLAAAGFCLGALPLIVYNSVSGLATFRSNSSFVFDQFSRKADVLRHTLDGSALLGYIASYPDQQTRPRPARTYVERAAYALHAGFGEHVENLLIPALLAALLLLPFIWRNARQEDSIVRIGGHGRRLAPDGDHKRRRRRRPPRRSALAGSASVRGGRFCRGFAALAARRNGAGCVGGGLPGGPKSAAHQSTSLSTRALRRAPQLDRCHLSSFRRVGQNALRPRLSSMTGVSWFLSPCCNEAGYLC